MMNDFDIAMLAEQNILILAELKALRHEMEELRTLIGETRSADQRDERQADLSPTPN